MGAMELRLLAVAKQIEKLHWSLEKEVLFLSKVDQIMLEVNAMEDDEIKYINY